MKKKNLLRTLSATVFIISLIIIYLYIYVSPSLKKTNRLKRGIKEVIIQIKNSDKEKMIFIGSNRKEQDFFKKIDIELEKKLVNSNGLLNENDAKIDIINQLISLTKRSNIKNFKIAFSKICQTDNGGENSNKSSIIKKLNFKINFLSKLNSGAKFIKKIPHIKKYLLIKNLDIKRSGTLFIFSIKTEFLFLNKEFTTKGKPLETISPTLIDYDSPLLNSPIYNSKLRLKTSVNPNKERSN